MHSGIFAEPHEPMQGCCWEEAPGTRSQDRHAVPIAIKNPGQILRMERAQGSSFTQPGNRLLLVYVQVGMRNYNIGNIQFHEAVGSGVRSVGLSCPLSGEPPFSSGCPKIKNCPAALLPSTSVPQHTVNVENATAPNNNNRVIPPVIYYIEFLGTRPSHNPRSRGARLCRPGSPLPSTTKTTMRRQPTNPRFRSLSQTTTRKSRPSM